VVERARVDRLHANRRAEYDSTAILTARTTLAAGGAIA
jgi:hypothetical protein